MYAQEEGGGEWSRKNGGGVSEAVCIYNTEGRS